MKTALELGHELAGESQQAITEALEAWAREVKAAALREAAAKCDLFANCCQRCFSDSPCAGCRDVTNMARRLRAEAERAERGE